MTLFYNVHTSVCVRMMCNQNRAAQVAHCASFIMIKETDNNSARGTTNEKIYDAEDDGEEDETKKTLAIFIFGGTNLCQKQIE